jgi:hypothetical protein
MPVNLKLISVSFEWILMLRNRCGTKQYIGFEFLNTLTSTLVTGLEAVYRYNMEESCTYRSVKILIILI